MRASVRAWTVAICAGLLFLAGCTPAPRDLDWDAVDTLIAKAFPGVPSLTTSDLSARLESGLDVILLDARDADEFAVSHLQGAHHVASDVDTASHLAASAPNALVVAYCSVGYRSAALVEQLRARGHTNALNLEGSIFQWVSEGRPVYRGQTQVTQVHPYDPTWGALLPEVLWSSEQRD